MTELLSILGLAALFIGFGLLARGREGRSCGGCRGKCDNDDTLGRAAMGERSRYDRP